jgi:hypothetical protein
MCRVILGLEKEEQLAISHSIHLLGLGGLSLSASLGVQGSLFSDQSLCMVDCGPFIDA